MASNEIVTGRLVLDDRVEPGHVFLEEGRIARIDYDEHAGDGPWILPGLIDLHVHGCGGYDAMGPEASLDGMARALLRHGVTSFLPTAVTAPLESLRAFGDRVGDWMCKAPVDGAEPLGFNLEGPFISPQLVGAQNPAFVRAPADVPFDDLLPLVGNFRLTTIAPELPGALELIRWLHEHGVISLARTLRRERRGGGVWLRRRCGVDHAPLQRDDRAPPSQSRPRDSGARPRRRVH